jgi:hypothetical protein
MLVSSGEVVVWLETPGFEIIMGEVAHEGLTAPVAFCYTEREEDARTVKSQV